MPRDGGRGRLAAALLRRLRLPGGPGSGRRRGDLRGSVGDGIAVGKAGGGGRDGDRQPLGVERDRREGRIPPHARESCLREVRRGIHLLRRGHRRIEHRRRLFRALPDRVERGDPRRKRTLRRRRSHNGRRRCRASPARPAQDEYLEGKRRRRPVLLPRRPGDRPRRRDRPPALHPEGGCRPPRRLLPHPRHPGARAREAHPGCARLDLRDRALRRPRLDAGAHRVGAGDGSSGPGAQRHPRADHALLRHDRADPLERRNARAVLRGAVLDGRYQGGGRRALPRHRARSRKPVRRV